MTLLKRDIDAGKIVTLLQVIRPIIRRVIAEACCIPCTHTPIHPYIFLAVSKLEDAQRNVDHTKAQAIVDALRLRIDPEIENPAGW